jgi:hypothetical protein
LVNLSDFSDLESVYKYLEEKAGDYKYPHQISDLFQRIRDRMHVEKNTDKEAKAQWEIDCFNFWIEDNEAKPLFTFANGRGKSVGYPDFNRFNDSTYDYFAERLDSSTNPLLRARYAHILWFSPRKHGKYAQIAIDSYLEVANLYEQKDKEKPRDHYGLDLLNAIKNAFLLSLNIKDEKRLDAVKSVIKRLIFDFNPKSSSSFILRAELIRLMLKEKSGFSKDDFVGINDICIKFAKAFEDLHKSITMLELGEKVENELGKITNDWRRLIAESYEKMMNASLPKSKFVAIKFCQDALECYRQLKDSEKIRELEGIYNQLKDAVEFKEFKVELNLGDYIKECEKKAVKIAKHSSEEIISLLTWDKNLLPKLNEMKASAEEILKEHPLQGLLPIVLTDERGHNAQHFSSKEEIAYYQTLQQYQLYLENQHLPLINAIILEALKDRKLSFTSIIDHIKKHCWYGTTFKRKIQNQEITYSWIDLLAPSLHEYFAQMEYCLASGKYPNLVLCIDSLILKIEGLLRDLCNLSGIVTFFQKKDQQGRTIYQEQDLNSLLHEEKMKELFGEDDLLFFRFVLVEKAGYNLRHRIAHSLILPQEYGVNYTHLLILSLLKVGKFSLRKDNKESKSD